MNVENRIMFCLAFTGLFAFGGSSFVWDAISYLLGFFAAAPSSTRNEYLEGTSLSLMIALPFWLLVSVFAFPIRSLLPRRVYVVLNTPAVVLGFGFIFLNLVGIVMMTLDWWHILRR